MGVDEEPSCAKSPLSPSLADYPQLGAWLPERPHSQSEIAIFPSTPGRPPAELPLIAPTGPSILVSALETTDRFASVDPPLGTRDQHRTLANTIRPSAPFFVSGRGPRKRSKVPRARRPTARPTRPRSARAIIGFPRRRPCPARWLDHAETPWKPLGGFDPRRFLVATVVPFVEKR